MILLQITRGGEGSLKTRDSISQYEHLLLSESP